MKKFNLPALSWFQAIEGSSSWYKGIYFENEVYYDVEDWLKARRSLHCQYEGNALYFIHYPDGVVFRPFEPVPHIFYDTDPVFVDGQLAFLAYDDLNKEVRLYTYDPFSSPLLEARFPFDQFDEMTSLRLEGSPLMLLTESDQNGLEIYWPDQKKINSEEDESFSFRVGDQLYFTSWQEEPEEKEMVIVKDYQTGQVIEERPGSIYLMPHGDYWLL